MGKLEDEFMKDIDNLMESLASNAQEAEKSMSPEELEQAKGFSEMASVFVDSVAKASNNNTKILTYACSCAFYEAIRTIAKNNKDLSAEEYSDLMCDILDSIEDNAKLAVMMVTICN